MKVVNIYNVSFFIVPSASDSASLCAL